MMPTLEETKRELQIFWNMTKEDEEKLDGQMKDAESILIQKHREQPIDFDKDRSARRLFFDLLKYIRSEAEAAFYSDYSQQLNELYLRAPALKGGEAVEKR